MSLFVSGVSLIFKSLFGLEWFAGCNGNEFHIQIQSRRSPSEGYSIKLGKKFERRFIHSWIIYYYVKKRSQRGNTDVSSEESPKNIIIIYLVIFIFVPIQWRSLFIDLKPARVSTNEYVLCAVLILYANTTMCIRLILRHLISLWTAIGYNILHEYSSVWVWVCCSCPWNCRRTSVRSIP